MITAQLNTDLLQARKAGDRLKAQTLQAMLARITNAQAIPVQNDSTPHVGVGSTEVPRRELTEAQVSEIVQDELQDLKDALTSMQPFPNHPYAAELKAKIDILRFYA